MFVIVVRVPDSGEATVTDRDGRVCLWATRDAAEAAGAVITVCKTWPWHVVEERDEAHT